MLVYVDHAHGGEGGRIEGTTCNKPELSYPPKFACKLLVELGTRLAI